MKKNIKKYTVLGLSGFMLFTWIFAAEGSTTVSAAEAVSEETETENGRNGEVFQAALPTDTDHVFDFIMDPQKLISRTDAAAYGNCVFEEGATLFFRRSDGECEEDYSSSSDALVIVNRGTADVDILLTASISSASMDGILLTDDRNFTDDMDTSLYLALTDGEHIVPINGDDGASLHAVLEGGTEEDGGDSIFRFWLTGAVNEKGDWSKVKDVVPKVTVTWCVTQKETTDRKATEEQEEITNQEIKADMDENSVLPEDQSSERNEMLKVGEDQEVKESMEGSEKKSETPENEKQEQDSETAEDEKQEQDSETTEDKKQEQDSETAEDEKQEQDSETAEDKKQEQDSKTAEDKKQEQDSETAEDKKQEQDSETTEDKKQEQDSETTGNEGKRNETETLENDEVKEENSSSEKVDGTEDSETSAGNENGGEEQP